MTFAGPALGRRAVDTSSAVKRESIALSVRGLSLRAYFGRVGLGCALTPLRAVSAQGLAPRARRTDRATSGEASSREATRAPRVGSYIMLLLRCFVFSAKNVLG